MISIVIHRDNADFYRSIDENPEPYFPEPMGSEGDNWVEMTIEDEESTDFSEISTKYNIPIEDIIAIGFTKDEDSEVEYITNI